MRNKTDKKFISQLEKLRGGRDKKQFAIDSGINPATMLGYLNGKSAPNLANLRQIAAANNVTVGWLVDDETIIYKDSPTRSQVVTGNNNISAGGKISDSFITRSTPQNGVDGHRQRMEGFLDDDELELIHMLRDIGGRRMVQSFKKELIRKQQIFDND
jgi:transcriptional regulator with XRE-family HTH domain